ncbi:hypothetical protein EDB92DRAFT_563030 [Lactarius akahatsu]|uniref:Uncharacterized protein n=1 Tax=Lactarius akahatsu TaxID=416441 RepID=A0AAD4QE81_9AGAM|nr:hypothetical protein EDB92DRAFT_563030 [Lactarius akahatsu]
MRFSLELVTSSNPCVISVLVSPSPRSDTRTLSFCASYYDSPHRGVVLASVATISPLFSASRCPLFTLLLPSRPAASLLPALVSLLDLPHPRVRGMVLPALSLPNFPVSPLTVVSLFLPPSAFPHNFLTLQPPRHHMRGVSHHRPLSQAPSPFLRHHTHSRAAATSYLSGPMNEARQAEELHAGAPHPFKDNRIDAHGGA